VLRGAGLITVVPTPVKEDPAEVFRHELSARVKYNLAGLCLLGKINRAMFVKKANQILKKLSSDLMLIELLVWSERLMAE